MSRRYAQSLLAIGLLGSMLMAACGGASPTAPSSTQGGSPPTEQTTSTATEQASGERSLTIEAVQGKVDVKAAGATAYSPAKVSQALGPGDEVRTGKDGKAVLLLDDGTKMVVSPDTSIQLAALSGTTQTPTSQFFMSLGKVFAVHKGELPDGASYEINTPSGVATIRGSYIAVVFFENSKTGTVMCLTGHCQYAPGSGQPVPLTGKKGVRFDQDGQQGDVFDLTPVHLQLWSDALDTLDGAGQDGTTGDVQCTCDLTVPTTLTCDDGAQYEEFPSCLPSDQDTGQGCSCDGNDLVCEDGTVYQDDSDCSDSDGEDFCSCDGTTSYCLDGSETEDDPSCSEDNACSCDGTTLVCGDESYEDDSACTENEGCECDGTTLVCGDDSYEDDPTCGGESEASCEQVSCGDGVCDDSCGEDSDSCSDDCAVIDETEVPEDEPTETVTEEEPTEEVDICEQVFCGDGSCDDSCGEDSDSCSDDCGGGGGGEAPTEEGGDDGSTDSGADTGGDDGGTDSGGTDSGGTDSGGTDAIFIMPGWVM